MKPQDPRTDATVGRGRRVIETLGILLVVIGQTLTFANAFQPPDIVPAGVWISLVGVAIFVGARWIKPALARHAAAAPLPSETGTWIAAAVILSGLALLAMIVFERYGRFNFLTSLTFWIGAGACYVAAFRPRDIAGVDTGAWFRAHRKELLWLSAITLLAAILRFSGLGGHPRIIDGDEGVVGLTAQGTGEGPLSNPFALWENFGALYLQMIHGAMILFGVSPYGLRFLPAVGGTLAIPAVYLLARQIAGWRTGLIAAAVIAVTHAHIHFSRIASVAYIQGTWLGPLELYLLLSGLQKRSSVRTAAAGVLLGMHFSVYLTAQVLVALVLSFMVLCLIFQRKWFQPALRQAAAFWGGLLIMIMPVATFAVRSPGDFMARLSQDGTFQSGWLAHNMQLTGQSAVQLLAGRVMHAFLSLFYYAPIDFYGSPVPTLSVISATLFLLGLGVCLWRTREPGVLLLNGYLCVPTLAVGIFAVPPSADGYRMLMALPAAVVMIAIGLQETLARLGLDWQERKFAYRAAIGSVLAGMLLFNAWTYYADFLGRCRFGGNRADRFSSHLGSYVSEQITESTIYLLSDANYSYGTHPSVDFLTGRRNIVNFPEPAEMLEPVSGEIIIASPDRVVELREWSHAHPGGELNYVRECNVTILSAYHYP